MNEFPMLARFNQWVNRRFYDHCAKLSDEEFRRDRQAFFGSIHNTLNHLLVVDRLWLDRIEGVENNIRALNQILYEDFGELRVAREKEDEHIVEIVDSMDEARLKQILAYTLISGATGETPIHLILITLFNHQTHHRGQVHTMLTQAGIRMPGSDIIDYLDDIARGDEVGT